MLNNGIEMPTLDIGTYTLAYDRKRRNNINEDTNRRKATRCNFQSVLSGLWVCAECNHNYRRIARLSGKIVWRCASCVKHGKKFCRHFPSVSEVRITELICEKTAASN